MTDWHWSHKTCTINCFANEYMKDHIFELRRKSWRHDYSSCVYNCDDYVFISFSTVQIICVIFHIFICILHHLQVYYKLTMWPVPSWLDSSVGRALHWYRTCIACRVQIPFRPEFFQASISQLLKLCLYITAMINHVLINCFCWCSACMSAKMSAEHVGVLRYFIPKIVCHM